MGDIVTYMPRTKKKMSEGIATPPRKAQRTLLDEPGDDFQAVLALNAYRIVSDAVESGLAYGWQRLFKHRDKPRGLPDDSTVVDELTQHIMNALSESVDWDGSGGRKVTKCS